MLTEKKLNALHWEEYNLGKIASYGIFEIYKEVNYYHLRIKYGTIWIYIDSKNYIDGINVEIQKFRENTSEILFQLEERGITEVNLWKRNSNSKLLNNLHFKNVSGFIEICNSFSKTLDLL